MGQRKCLSYEEKKRLLQLRLPSDVDNVRKKYAIKSQSIGSKTIKKKRRSKKLVGA